MRRILATMLGLLIVISQLQAQTRTITGRVTDDKGNALPNASVRVKGSTTGVSSDLQGNFSISIAPNATTLIVSSVGFTETEIDINNRSSINVNLLPTDQSMQEVVVVAYGTLKRESITGSVSTIGTKQLENRLTTNITQALAGAAPGIAATSGNGQPGSTAGIRIRGFGSVNASSSPLYVVDGFPYEGELGDLNTNDIESISLLKDASSTALYGSRAANGVVLITTKKGTSATPKVNITASTGYSQRGIDEYNRVGTFDYYPVMWQALKNSLMFPASGTPLSEAAASAQASATIATQLIYNPFNVANNSIVGTDGKLNPNASLLYNDFDWYSPLSRNGSRNEVSLNTSAKINKSDYYVSFNYLKDNGFVLESDYQRASGKINLNTELKSWLKSGINLTGVIVTSNQASASLTNANSFINPFQFARGIGPIYPIHAYTTAGQPVLDANGVHVYDYGQHAGAVNRPSGAMSGRHVIYETMLNDNVDTRNSMIGRAFLEGNFLNDFTLRLNGGLDLNNYRTSTFRNKIVGDGVTPGGLADRESDENRTISFNQILNYQRQFGNHKLQALLGHETQWINETDLYGARRGMNLDGNVELVNFVTLDDLTGYFNNVRREAYFSRVNYTFNDKYIGELSYRRDGSSKFARQSRWGNFYSIGAAWFVNRESFLNNVSWINELKLRAAYGEVGNDNLLNSDGTPNYYAYQALYELGWNNAAEPGAIATKLANPDLTWETNTTKSIGVDFGFLKNRISGSLDLFERGSSGLLFDVPQGLTSIVTTRTENIGTMKNRGVELQLNGDILRHRDFNWDIQINATHIKNEITKLPNGQAITDGVRRLEEGRDRYAFYVRQWYGVDPLDGAALWYALPGTTTGYRLSDKGDTLVTNPTNAKYDFSGSAIPDLFGSLGTNFNFKGFGLSVLLNYQLGGKFYDAVYHDLVIPAYGSSLHTDVLNSWQKPGDVTDFPRLDISQGGVLNSMSNRFLIDASYISLRNVVLSYTLNRDLASRIKMNQVKFYVSGENLMIKSKRKGLNPSESFDGENNNVYVPNRILSAGLNITF